MRVNVGHKINKMNLHITIIKYDIGLLSGR